MPTSSRAEELLMAFGNVLELYGQHYPGPSVEDLDGAEDQFSPPYTISKKRKHQLEQIAAELATMSLEARKWFTSAMCLARKAPVEALRRLLVALTGKRVGERLQPEVYVKLTMFHLWHTIRTDQDPVVSVTHWPSPASTRKRGGP